MSDDSERLESIVSDLRGLLAKARASADTKRAALNDAALSLKACDVTELMIGARRIREQFLSEPMFGEPAWDILLQLHLAFYREEAVSITAAATFGNNSPTTGYRWLNYLESAGLVERRPDPTDHRRQFVGLTQKAVVKLDRFIARYTEWVVTKAAAWKL